MLIPLSASFASDTELRPIVFDLCDESEVWVVRDGESARGKLTVTKEEDGACLRLDYSFVQGGRNFVSSQAEAPLMTERYLDAARRHHIRLVLCLQATPRPAQKMTASVRSQFLKREECSMIAPRMGVKELLD